VKVLGIYGSPREGGNSDLLLLKALEGARSAGAEVTSLRAADLDMGGCQECGACFETCRQGAIIDPDGNRSPKKNKGKKVVKAHIDSAICAGCLTCLLNCPQEAIREVKKGFFSASHCRVDAQGCVGCGTCTQFCITDAIKLS
jgi:ferredoxin